MFRHTGLESFGVTLLEANYLSSGDVWDLPQRVLGCGNSLGDDEVLVERKGGIRAIAFCCSMHTAEPLNSTVALPFTIYHLPFPTRAPVAQLHRASAS